MAQVVKKSASVKMVASVIMRMVNVGVPQDISDPRVMRSVLLISTERTVRSHVTVGTGPRSVIMCQESVSVCLGLLDPSVREVSIFTHHKETKYYVIE